MPWPSFCNASCWLVSNKKRSSSKDEEKILTSLWNTRKYWDSAFINSGVSSTQHKHTKATKQYHSPTSGNTCILLYSPTPLEEMIHQYICSSSGHCPNNIVKYQNIFTGGNAKQGSLSPVEVLSRDFVAAYLTLISRQETCFKQVYLARLRIFPQFNARQAPA